jgi:hypothetical protein
MVALLGKVSQGCLKLCEKMCGGLRLGVRLWERSESSCLLMQQSGALLKAMSKAAASLALSIV